jgi:hypothetical protein
VFYKKANRPLKPLGLDSTVQPLIGIAVTADGFELKVFLFVLTVSFGALIEPTTCVTSHFGEELSRASADLRNDIVKWYWRTVDRQDHRLSNTAMDRWHCKSHDGLPSQTAQAAVDQFYEAIGSWHGMIVRGGEKV